jgi:DNA-binding NarL/FixJ family response regulator
MKLAQMPVKVLIYDDNADRRESLSMLLQSYSQYQVCNSYADCSNVVQEVAANKPDVVLMDIQMPNVDGLQGVKLIRENFPDIKVIMQTVFDDDEKIFEAILNGASGYILKRTSSEKVIEAINDALEGGSPMTPSIAAKVLAHFRQQTQSAIVDYQLTDKEKVILNHLVSGLSYKMIADKCAISYHTVNSHIKKIYEKLHVHSVSEAVSKALNEKIVVR